MSNAILSYSVQADASSRTIWLHRIVIKGALSAPLVMRSFEMSPGEAKSIGEWLIDEAAKMEKEQKHADPTA